VFRGVLGRLYGVSLPFPSLSGADPEERLSSFKRFCSAPLERRSNEWTIALERSRLSSDARHSIYMSLFLFRKILKTREPCMASFLEKVSTPSPEPDCLFMEFLRVEVARMFPSGWDRAYPDQCICTIVPTKSCAENPAMFGGSRGMILRNSHFDWENARLDFVESVLSSSTPSLGEGSASRVVNVPTAGKWRTLSVPPLDMNRLRPLHKTIYDRLSRFKWLLRGDAKATSFKDFCMKEGEVFVSGDYESATDNLNSDVQKEILRLVLQSSKHVPQGIIVDAMRSFSLNLTGTVGVTDDGSPVKRTVRQRSGQMMGNLLSFPLLCLVNYLTFRWLVMDDTVPVKINGDDIVFRSTPQVADRWMEGVGASGLVLSRGKTMVDRRYFTLNSCLFKAKRSGVVPLAFIRSKALFGIDDEGCPAGSLSGRFSSAFPGFYGRRRTLLRSVFLRENSGYLKASCRSIRLGLGVPVRPCDLKESGLWCRELRYLSLGGERSPAPTFSVWSHTPVGYRIAWVSKDRKQLLGRDPELKSRLIEAGWQCAKKLTPGQYNNAIATGVDLSDRRLARGSARLEKMAKLTKQTYAKVRYDSRIEVGAWNLGCISSYDSWTRLRNSGQVGDLWDRFVERRERLYPVYLPISRDINMVSSAGRFTVDTNLKLTDSCPKDEVSDDRFSAVCGRVQPRLFPPPLVY